MAARNHRPSPAKSTQRKAPPSAETKLKHWGECADQQSMFSDQQLWSYKYGKAKS